MEGQDGGARVEGTVEGFDSEKVVLGACKCLTALIPFVGLTSAFPIDGFSTSRCFGKGVDTVRPEDLMPARELPLGDSRAFRTVFFDCSPAVTYLPELSGGREMGETISGTGLMGMGFRAGVGS